MAPRRSSSVASDKVLAVLRLAAAESIDLSLGIEIAEHRAELVDHGADR